MVLHPQNVGLDLGNSVGVVVALFFKEEINIQDGLAHADHLQSVC